MLHVPQAHWRTYVSGPLVLFLVSCTTEITDPPGMNAAAGSTAGVPSGTGGAGAPGSGGAANSGGTPNGAGGLVGASGNGASGSGGTPPVSADGLSGVKLQGSPAYHRFVRLTHDQWEASVRDVLKLTALPGLSASFASDPPNGTFSNNERALFVSSTLWSDYERAAESLSTKIAGDAQALAKLTGGSTDSAAFIRSFGRRAFRRPLTSAEEQSYQKLFAQGPTLVGSGNAFADGVQLMVETVLQSPKFLYRSELGNDGAALSSYEMASKLSFLIRNTTPDDALLDAAGRGELASSSGVIARATTMLGEAAAEASLERYHAELFGLARYSSIDKNRTKFPAYKEELNAEFELADRMFFDRIFKNDLGVRDILTSPLAFVSASTAPMYGVTASGQGLVEVTLGPDRPGLLTRLGFLAYNGNLSDPDPIHRGVDIINRLMCLDLLPPANVDIPPLPAVMSGQTNRQRVEGHTGDGTCGQGCHSTLINPMGFAFENFDALGQSRTMDNGKPVDTTGSVSLAGQLKQFGGAPELVSLLSTAPAVHGCYAKHLTEFTLMRDVADKDRAVVDRVETVSVKSSASVKAMLLELIAAPSFLNRNGGA
jgi:hypothetical protein